MRNNPPSGPVADAVRDLVEEMGYVLLEFSHQHVKGRTHVHCVVHAPAGVDLDSLTTIHRALQPQLEALLDSDDLRIEFSSPGMERTLKSFHEFAAFIGRPVSVLEDGRDEWISATVVSAADDSCQLELDGGETKTYTPAALQKVRLLD